MSEEIVNNEVQNTEAQNNIPETETQEQNNNTENEQKGSVQTEEKQKEESASKFVKVGREMKQKVTAYNTDARNAIAREVAEIARNKETLLTQKQALIDKFNQDMFKIESEIKALEQEAKEKSEIACTGEKRQQILCDTHKSDTEFVYTVPGGDPEKESDIVARTQRTPEEKGEVNER